MSYPKLLRVRLAKNKQDTPIELAGRWRVPWRFSPTAPLVPLLFLVALGSQQSPRNQTPPRGPDVKLSLIVIDRDGRPLNDLTKNEVAIFEDKIPQTVSSFSEDKRPVDYGIAIDCSGSFRNLLDPIIDAAKLLIEDQKDNDQTFIERFISSEKTYTE